MTRTNVRENLRWGISRGVPFGTCFPLFSVSRSWFAAPQYTEAQRFQESLLSPQFLVF